MKTKNFQKKLVLKKKTIANLNNEKMGAVIGGCIPGTPSCPTSPHFCESIDYCIVTPDCPETMLCPTGIICHP
jgi:hypothetical protein